MDALVGDYLEHLWADGEGRAAASNFLAALQDFDPKLRGQLPMSWRLMRTWATNEVPNRVSPLMIAISSGPAAAQRISGSADQRTSGSADQRISGSADQRTSGPADQRISGSADQRIPLVR